MNVAAEAFSADDENCRASPHDQRKNESPSVAEPSRRPASRRGVRFLEITSHLQPHCAAVDQAPEVRLEGDDIYWLEDRPQENGRCVVVRAPDSSINSAPYSARTEVHTYGGGAWIVDNGILYFSNFSDGRLYRQDRSPAQPDPITPAPPSPERNWRYADGFIDRARKRWLGVREDHTDPKRAYPNNTIVAVPLSGPVSSAGTILASGRDFYSSPRLSPREAWTLWRRMNRELGQRLKREAARRKRKAYLNERKKHLSQARVAPCLH
jgi:hypothetical protein